MSDKSWLKGAATWVPDMADEQLGTCTQQPCYDGDHYGQCRDVTAPYFPAAEPEAAEPAPEAG